jgi:hypothetical protein
MHVPRFPGSAIVVNGSTEFELVERDACQSRDLLDALRDEVLEIAAASRGWADADSLTFFRRYFKIGPLYETNALALARQSGRLVGLAGAINDWHVAEGSIVHLCSLGLLPSVQARGILPVLMLLLWQVTLRSPIVDARYRQRRLFFTAITQSPYILDFMSRVGSIYPSPDRLTAEPDEIAIARHVAARLDPHLAFDEGGFVLRKECEFRYQRLPISQDRRLNQFCIDRLNHDDGDVFVVVGRADPNKIARFSARVMERYPAMVTSFESALRIVKEPAL